MSNPRYARYEGGVPYFNPVRGALADLVDGEHFFDTISDDIAGWPRVVRGRADLMAEFRGYCDNIRLESADKLIIHTTDGARVIKVAHWTDYMDSPAVWNALTTRNHNKADAAKQ